MDDRARELSLFTGSGGGILGSKLLNHKIIGMVEYNEYCQQVLAQRIADGHIDKCPIFTDVREFIQSGAAEQYRGITDIITGGPPCQSFSVAGKQLGEHDERNMWPATIDIVRIVRPTRFLFENVPGMLRFEYTKTVFAQLANLGYGFKYGIISASDVGARHKRARLWIVGKREDVANA